MSWEKTRKHKGLDLASPGSDPVAQVRKRYSVNTNSVNKAQRQEGPRTGLKDGTNRASLKDICRKYMAFHRKPWEVRHAPAELLTGSSRKNISAIKEG